MPQDLNCMKACSVMIYFNLPPEGRFRKWRGYQKVAMPQLEWLENIERIKSDSSPRTDSLQAYDQYIKLIDPKEARVTL